MKVLFLNPEQYLDWQLEPSNYELRLPVLHCGAVTEHHDYVYQRVLRSEGRHAMNVRALHEFYLFRPDVVIHSTSWPHEVIDPWVFQEMMARGVPVYTHVWDSHIEHAPHEIEWFNNCSYFGIADSVTNYLHYRDAAREHPQVKGVLFSAGNIAFTDNLCRSPEPKLYDLTILGSNEGYRAELVRGLRERLEPLGVRVNKSGGLIDSAKLTDPTKGLSDNWVSWDEYARVINQSKIGLSSPTNLLRQQLKGKVIHYMACGILCLTDRNSEIESLIPEGCVVFYDGVEDCAAKVQYYLRHDTEREAIAQAGYEWFRSTFNYKKFWREFLVAAQRGDRVLPEVPLRTPRAHPHAGYTVPSVPQPQAMMIL